MPRSHPAVFRATHPAVRASRPIPPRWPGITCSSADDLALVRTKRRAVNRLGFAVQLCLLRHPGHGLDPASIRPSR